MNWLKATCVGASLFCSAYLYAATAVTFKQFNYEGKDAIFNKPLNAGEFQNPILAGFYPDPSITRAGDDYYLVVSSFSYSPGVPIFHSKDLVHWESLGHILVTPKQLPLYKQQVSRGIYAPTIRYHDGIFYLITTLVDVRGNFMVTATNPAGPWSDPIELPEVGGIDPDIFFDDDGRVYITHNNSPIGEPLYNGHRAIWQWEFDLKTQKIIKNSGHVIVNGGTDISKKPVWIEAPHIYKINGWYYLLCAEGGTGYDHSEVVFRTRKLTEPFVPFTGNPILTQRDLDINRPHPITTAGHADFVQTKEGEWWAVFLATRSYDKTAYNTGRETFLLPMKWQNEWPIIVAAGNDIPYRLTAPAIAQKTKNAEPLSGNFKWKDEFKTASLSHHWNILGTLTTPWYRFNKQGGIDIIASANRLSGLAQPAFIGRRQQHTHFDANTTLQLPTAEHISAGISAFQSEVSHYYLAVEKSGKKYNIFIEQTNKTAPNIIYRSELNKTNIGSDITLGIEGDAGKISFYYDDKHGTRVDLLKDADGKILSTEVAGGFVGVYLGMYVRTEP